MSLQSIKYSPGKLEILDQLLLPVISKYITVKGVEDCWKVINRMQVRMAYILSLIKIFIDHKISQNFNKFDCFIRFLYF